MSSTLDDAIKNLKAAQANMDAAKAGLDAAKAAYAQAAQEQNEIDAKARGARDLDRAHAEAALPWDAPASKPKRAGRARAQPEPEPAPAHVHRQAATLGAALWRCKSDEQAEAVIRKAKIDPAALDERDEVGQTCLIKCAMKGFAKGCVALVEMGANPNARSRVGEGALALSAICGRVAAFKALLFLGADATELDNDGNGIVHKIIDCESREAKTMLLLAIEKGADAHAPNKRGLTPLRMMTNMGIMLGDPRYDAYLHIAALAEAKAIADIAGGGEGLRRAPASRL